MRGFVSLIVLACFVGAIAAGVILATAVNRTWNETHMTIAVVAVSLFCLSIPTVVILIGGHYVLEDRREGRAERKAKAEEGHLSVLLKLAKQQADAQVAAQRVVTEEHRSARVAASVPQLPAPVAPTGNAWEAYTSEVNEWAYSEDGE